MKRSPLLSGLSLCAGLLILIFDSKTALAGARTGLELCIQVVIPSLFPFFVLSIGLNRTLSGASLPFLTPLRRLFRIPAGTDGILLSGFLGGYPAGAQAVGSAYAAGLLTKKDANRMLAFCSNAGPAFLFGMAGPMFSNPAVPFLLWGIHIGSALLVSLLGEGCDTASVEAPAASAQGAVMDKALRVTAAVCGWVILFRVVMAFLERWFLWLLPGTGQILVLGLLELSNGCIALGQIGDPSVRFVLCALFLSWGGLCVAMQTKSVIGDLSMGCYLRGKLLQAVFSLLLSMALVLRILLPVGASMVFFVLLLGKRRNKGGISLPAGV